MEADFVNFAAPQQKILHKQIQRAVFAVFKGSVPCVGEFVVSEDRAFGKMLSGLDEGLVDGVPMHKFSDVRIVESAELIGDIPVRDFCSEALANFFDVFVGCGR